MGAEGQEGRRCGGLSLAAGHLDEDTGRIVERFGRGVAAAVAVAAGQPGVRWVRLFGSRARGDAQERSDIDLAVSCPDESDWLALLDAMEEAPTLLKIDLLRWEAMTGDLCDEVMTEGVVLFER